MGADKKFFAKKKHDIYPLNETRATSTFAKKMYHISQSN